MRFSLVIPACNVAPYAEELIASLKAQTVPEFEALLVSEESTDGTREALEHAIAGDSRFQLIRLPRSGSASVSRNYGIEHARGDYLVFIDGDDWIEPDSLARFSEALDRFPGIDLLLVDWVIHHQGGRPEGEVMRCHPLNPERVYSGPESFTLRLEKAFYSGSPLHVTRREFLLENDLRQIPGHRHEDTEWLPRLNYAAQSVVYLPYPYYHYRRRPDSVTTSYNPKSMADLTDSLIGFAEFRFRHDFSPRLRRAFADWVGFKAAGFFGTHYTRRHLAELRRSEYRRLCATGTAGQQLRALLREGGISQKTLAFLLALAARPGGFGPAEALFHHVHQPLLQPLLGFLKRRKSRNAR